MASFNKVHLIGNLTRDPQIRHLPNQSIVADFGIAVNRRFRTASGEDREDVTFVDCAAFGKQAEVIHQYCRKGKQLFIEGRLKFDSWDDKQGNKRSKLSVVVENFQFLGSRGGEQAAPQSGQAGEQRPAPAPNRQAARQPAEKPFGNERKFEEADIPF